MDSNLRFWKSEGKTFSQRFFHWIDILDPLLLFKSQEEIKTSRELLLTSGPDITKSLLNKKIKEAWNLSLASVNPSTGDIVPPIFRLPAFLPLTVPLVLGTSLLPNGVKHAFLGQLLFHTYITSFNLAHGNTTRKPEEFPHKQMLLTTGAIVYSASTGAFPHYILTRFQLQSPAQLFLKKIIPAPLTAFLCAFNVLIIRGEEYESGIEIMDSNGCIVGVSKKAGEKAVKETAFSRAVMIGTALFIPDIALHYLKRTNILIRNPLVCSPLKFIMMVSVLGVMIPVSFSWMPQLGTIQRSLIEPEIISSTEETEFFYNRGV
ncbi:sideroflexin-4 isoform X2 [Eublepharis macularius]|uniref:Sideroflexin-4 isoform X2 n=1 Tax=Eublepharis macularius TaxID=481883 RepID=A0AA97JHT4_EUBMA|nr:sideroflexin-4 isoform X2 [Eublepharis macularius]